MNWGTAAILLGRWFARKNRVEIVGTELNSFVIGLANPAAVEGGSAETFEPVQIVNRQAVTWIVTLDLANGVGSHGRIDATVNVDIVIDGEVSVQLLTVIIFVGHVDHGRALDGALNPVAEAGDVGVDAWITGQGAANTEGDNSIQLGIVAK